MGHSGKTGKGALSKSGCVRFDVIGVDWKTDPATARSALPGKCLQGIGGIGYDIL